MSLPRYQESRAQLGLETARNRAERSVERTVPGLWGVWTLTWLWALRHPEHLRGPRKTAPW